MLLLTPILLLSCIAIAIALYLFLKTIDDTKKWRIALLAILITPLVYFYIWYPILTIFLPYHHQKEFNNEQWTKKPGLRYEMIDNMIATKFLLSHSKSDIKQLLGPSEWFGWNSDTNDFDANVWNYGLGVIPGVFKPTKEDICIRFKNDSLISVKLSQSTFIVASEKDRANIATDSILQHNTAQ